EHLGGQTFGIEVARDRYEEARGRIDHVLHASAFEVRVAHEAFSVLWLNPPYDYADDGQRLEHAFLIAASRYLCRGGVLVFLVPQRRLRSSARFLAGQFTRLACYRFPGSLYADFHQVALLAVKRDSPAPAGPNRTLVEAW